MSVQSKAELEADRSAAYPVTEINQLTLESALVRDIIDTLLADQVIKTADYTVIITADSGQTFASALDNMVFTLPPLGASAVGNNFVFINIADDATAKISIDPAAADGITYAGTAVDNKDLINTKATAKKGDFVTLASLDGVVSWQVVAIRGIWAKEA